MLFGMVLFNLAACKKTEEPQPTKNPSQLLDEKAANYMVWSKEVRDEFGFIHGHCDSLLFSSLYCDALGDQCDVNIFQAEGEPGQWFRHAKQDCFVDGQDNGSKTTISRDMFLGLFQYLWKTGNGEAVKRIVEFGKVQDPKFYMGQGINDFERESRTNLRGPLTGTLFQMLFKLTGEDDDRRKNLQLDNPAASGFEAHLAVRHIYLRALVNGAMSDLELRIVKGYRDSQPMNAFFQAVYHRYKDGDQTDAINLLLREELFPSDRLPTGGDRCEEYLFQRDYDRDEELGDWAPCLVKNEDGSVNEPATTEARAKKYSGVDLLDTWCVLKDGC